MPLRSHRRRSFDVPVQHLSLRITCADDRYEEARAIGMQVWEQIQAYAVRDPGFGRSKRPLRVPTDAPDVVREMAATAAMAGVGPMFSFRGALVDYVGRSLAPEAGEIVVSSGGDHFLVARSRSRLSVATTADGRSSLAVVVRPDLGPHGILATTDPRSLPAPSMDGIVVVARSCILADAAAASAAAILTRPRSFRAALSHLESIEGVYGAILLKGTAIGLAGELELAA
jgi:ApbE superfamily uncharacterized protein (UPF0280 family)